MDKLPNKNFNARGEIIREDKLEKKELPLGLRLYELYNSSQSILPDGFENPESLKYYSKHNINDIKTLFNELRYKIEQDSIEYTIDWEGKKNISANQAIEYIEKSILFSENINTILEKNHSQTQDTKIDDDLRQSMIDKLRKK